MSTETKHPGLGEQSQPQAPPAETGVNLREFNLDGGNLDAALQALLDHEAEIEALEARLKAAGQARANAEKAVIDKMLEQGLESFRALGKTVTRTERVHPSVLKDDRDKQMEWLQEIGMGALIQPTVNSNSFAGLIRKDFIEAKKEAELPEFVKIYRELRLTIRTVAK
jgi:hypothetical protein